MCKQLAEEDSNMQSETVPEDMTVSDDSPNKKKAGRLKSTTITPTKDLSPDLKKWVFYIGATSHPVNAVFNNFVLATNIIVDPIPKLIVPNLIICAAKDLFLLKSTIFTELTFKKGTFLDLYYVSYFQDTL